MAPVKGGAGPLLQVPGSAKASTERRHTVGCCVLCVFAAPQPQQHSVGSLSRIVQDESGSISRADGQHDGILLDYCLFFLYIVHDLLSLSPASQITTIGQRKFDVTLDRGMDRLHARQGTSGQVSLLVVRTHCTELLLSGKVSTTDDTRQSDDTDKKDREGVLRFWTLDLVPCSWPGCRCGCFVLQPCMRPVIVRLLCTTMEAPHQQKKEPTEVPSRKRPNRSGQGRTARHSTWSSSAYPPVLCFVLCVRCLESVSCPVQCRPV